MHVYLFFLLKKQTKYIYIIPVNTNPYPRAHCPPDFHFFINNVGVLTLIYHFCFIWHLMLCQILRRDSFKWARAVGRWILLTGLIRRSLMLRILQWSPCCRDTNQGPVQGVFLPRPENAMDWICCISELDFFLTPISNNAKGNYFINVLL